VSGGAGDDLGAQMRKIDAGKIGQCCDVVDRDIHVIAGRNDPLPCEAPQRPADMNRRQAREIAQLLLAKRYVKRALAPVRARRSLKSRDQTFLSMPMTTASHNALTSTKLVRPSAAVGS